MKSLSDQCFVWAQLVHCWASGRRWESTPFFKTSSPSQHQWTIELKSPVDSLWPKIPFIFPVQTDRSTSSSSLTDHTISGSTAVELTVFLWCHQWPPHGWLANSCLHARLPTLSPSSFWRRPWKCVNFAFIPDVARSGAPGVCKYNRCNTQRLCNPVKSKCFLDIAESEADGRRALMRADLASPSCVLIYMISGRGSAAGNGQLKTVRTTVVGERSAPTPLWKPSGVSCLSPLIIPLQRQSLPCGIE